MRKRINKLQNQVTQAEKHRSILISHHNKLSHKYNSGHINFHTYNQKVEEWLKGKSLASHMEDYSNFISKAKEKIQNLEQRLLSVQPGRNNIAIILIIVLSLGTFGYLIGPSIIGFSTLDQQPGPTGGKDSYLRQDSAASNFGSSTQLQLGNTSTSESLRPVFYINVSNISAQSTVTAADFYSYVSFASSTTTIQGNLYRLTQDWTENEVTWTNRTAATTWNSGGTFSSTLEAATNISNTIDWYSWNIKDLVQYWVNGTYENYGFILIADDEADNYRIIYSSDYTDNTGLRPYLNITFTPNAPPNITANSDNSNSTNPTNVGDNVTFNVTWTDIDSTQANIHICNSSDISFPSGCLGRQFCNTSLSENSSISCGYKALESDNTTVEYFIGLCDNEDSCYNSTVQTFEVNHNASVVITRPAGGELINQTEGNFSLEFNVSDQDNDTLSADLYFSTTSNITETLIVSALNLSVYCNDIDGTTATVNNCSYNWNSTGVGVSGINYWLDIVVNDSLTISQNTSNSSFSIVNLQDVTSPLISNITATSNITSGETILITVNITDDFVNTVTLQLNHTNTTLKNSTFVQQGSTEIYNITFEAANNGTYYYTIFANDSLGNTNTSDTYNYTVSVPNATAQTPQSPTTATPGSVILITGILNSTDVVKGVYAYLSANSEFSFQSATPQNQSLADIAEDNYSMASWYVAVPNTQTTYTLNISYTDNYSNSWQSSNFEIQVTAGSSSNATFVDISPYVETEAGNDFVAEIHVKDGNGAYVDADSVTIRLYDPVDDLTVGPVSTTTNLSTGRYEYNKTTTSSWTGGHWSIETEVSRNSIIYNDTEFFKITSGPFDVRDISITDSSVSILGISVILENLGGSTKDMVVNWNLTRTDTGATLDYGQDTIGVSGGGTSTHTIEPSTSYLGGVKITFLGYYGTDFTEVAGAFKTFTTTESGNETTSTVGGGGGGGSSKIKETIIIEAPNPKMEIIDALKDIIMTAGYTGFTDVTINNSGNLDLSFVFLNLTYLPATWYSVTPKYIEVLHPNESSKFRVTFAVPANTTLDRYNFVYYLGADEAFAIKPGSLMVRSELGKVQKLLKNATDIVTELKEKIQVAKELGMNTSKVEILLELAEDKLREANLHLKIDKQKTTKLILEADLFIIKALEEFELLDYELEKIKRLEMPKEPISLSLYLFSSLWIVLLIGSLLVVNMIRNKLKIYQFISTKFKRRVRREKVEKYEPPKPKISRFDEEFQELEDQLEVENKNEV